MSRWCSSLLVLSCSSQYELLDGFSAGTVSCSALCPHQGCLPASHCCCLVVFSASALAVGTRGVQGAWTWSSGPRLELEFSHPFPLLVRGEAEPAAQQQLFILETYTQSSSVFWFLKRQNSLEPVQRGRLVQASWETLPERSLAGAALSRCTGQAFRVFLTISQPFSLPSRLAEMESQNCSFFSDSLSPDDSL